MRTKLDRTLAKQGEGHTESPVERVFTTASHPDTDLMARAAAPTGKARVASGKHVSGRHPTMTHALVVETADGRSPPEPTPERPPVQPAQHGQVAKMVAGERADLLVIIGNHLRILVSRLRPDDGRTPGVLLRTVRLGLTDAAQVVESQAAHQVLGFGRYLLDLERSFAEHFFAPPRQMAFAFTPDRASRRRRRTR